LYNVVIRAEEVEGGCEWAYGSVDVENYAFVVDRYGEGRCRGVGRVGVLMQKGFDPADASK
jgi:hypothetical protein